MSVAYDQTPIYQRPEALLQQLIRFDTTNPPGDEAACVAYIADLLRQAGIATTLLARDPARPNLIARLKGRGNAPPLLLQGHLDVVTTEHQTWGHPPFAGALIDGEVWGRGALDMKGGVAMLLAAFMRAAAEGVDLPGDVMLAVLSDEEESSANGAKFLVEEHRALFAGIRYALGEFGGFTMQVAGRRFYPIMVAEKQICWLRAIARGPGGHGALPMRGGAMARLGHLLQRLDHQLLPVHITPVVRMQIAAMAAALPAPTRLLLLQLLNPRLTDRVLALFGNQGQGFVPLFRHTVNATVVHGGQKINVIPSEIVVDLDGRMLPGSQPADLIGELCRLTGDAVEYEVIAADPRAPEPDMGLFGTLASILRAADPTGTPIPLLLPGVTDGRFFARLGIQTYGFLPMILPEAMSFTRLIHAADERIPVAALRFGARAIFEALRRFG